MPVPAVVRPLIRAVAICASFALLTAFAAMVVAIVPVPDPVTSPVRVVLPPPPPKAPQAAAD